MSSYNKCRDIAIYGLGGAVPHGSQAQWPYESVAEISIKLVLEISPIFKINMTDYNPTLVMITQLRKIQGLCLGYSPKFFVYLQTEITSWRAYSCYICTEQEHNEFSFLPSICKSHIRGMIKKLLSLYDIRILSSVILVHMGIMHVDNVSYFGLDCQFVFDR